MFVHSCILAGLTIASSSSGQLTQAFAGGAFHELAYARVGAFVELVWRTIEKQLALAQGYAELDLSLTETNDIRCPDPAMAEKMIRLIKKVRKAGDTIGGVVSAVVTGCPVGLGEPVFDKLHADLGKAMLSINATKGFEYGSGFEGVKMLGSAHNDLFRPLAPPPPPEGAEPDAVEANTPLLHNQKTDLTLTNHSGGIQGGISNGMDIYFRVAFKPVATIMRDQASVNAAGEAVTLRGKGRHDPCVVPRAVPIVEAMAALVLADHLLRQRVNGGGVLI